MIKNAPEPFPHMLSSDSVSTIIEAAITTGHISTDNLCLVMAYSGPLLYDDGLSWLLNKYDIEEPDLSTVEGRFTGWKTLFDTWCHGTYDGIHIKTPDGFPLQEAKNLFTRLDLKFPELLFPPQGMTPWLFPELDYEKLSDTALKWAKKYPFLKQIRLYKNPDQTGSDGRYLLIFETHDQAEYAGTYENNVFNSRYSEMTVTDSDFEKDLKEIYKEGHVPPSNLSTPWYPWIIRQKEPVFDSGYPEPFNIKSGLGEQSHHWTLYGPHYEEVLSDTGKLVENSMLMGRISDGDLITVLSNEIWFTQKHLPYLWERFGCDSGGRIGDLSRVGYTQNRWMQFLYRIMHGFVRPGVHPKKNHGFDPDFLKSSVKDGVEYINIDDFRAYFIKWAADIPVDEYPVLLRQEPTPMTTSESEDLGYCASQKKSCRAAVTEIIIERKREGKPPLGSIEWYDRPDLREFQDQKNGGRITEKTFYSWITDLVNPNKNPGPIKGTRRTKKVHQAIR